MNKKALQMRFKHSLYKSNQLCQDKRKDTSLLKMQPLLSTVECGLEIRRSKRRLFREEVTK